MRDLDSTHACTRAQSRITDAGFTGRGLRIFNRLVRRGEYIIGINHKAVDKFIEKSTRFGFGNNESWNSTHTADIPTMAANESKQANFRAISGDAGLGLLLAYYQQLNLEVGYERRSF